MTNLHQDVNFKWCSSSFSSKGKIAENTVYACALLSAHADAHDTKGKLGMISRMFDQAN